MGTKAVFVVASQNPGCHYTMCLGRTIDGSQQNLLYVAQLCCEVAKRLGIWEKFASKDFHAVKKVFDVITSDNSDAWFVSNTHNAQWVSYSARLDPETMQVDVYDGILEDILYKRILSHTNQYALAHSYRLVCGASFVV